MINARFGKHPAKADYRTLRLGDYLMPNLPAPPPTFNVLNQVLANLSMLAPNTSVSTLFPMDGNDSLGDCTIAALAHAETVFSALGNSTQNIMAAADVIKLYYQLTGGIDSGMAELDVLNYWQSHPLDPTVPNILAYTSIHKGKHAHVQSAIQLFGGVYLGFQVQENAVDDFDAGKTWDVAPLTQDGHAVYAVAYDVDTISVLTWGGIQKGTWAWWDECVDECYALIPNQALSANFAPGFNFKQLMADLRRVAK